MLNFKSVYVLLILNWLIFYKILPILTTNDSGKYSFMYRTHLQRMVNVIDTEIEACDDFFQHACGNYNGTQELVPPFLYNKQDRRDFFEAHYNKFSTHVGILLKNMYLGCKARTEMHVFKPKPKKTQWEQMLAEIYFLKEQQVALKQWPYLQHQWLDLQTKYNLSWLNLAAQLAAHDIHTLVRIYFAEQAVFVEPLNLRNCPSLKTYQDTLLPFLQQNARSPQIAEIIANELFQLCQELTQPAADIYLKQESIKLMADYFGQFFLQLNFSAAELAAAEKLPVHKLKLLRVFSILQATEPRIVFNYIIWQTFEQLRFDDCYELTDEFEQLIHTEYWAWHVFDKYFERNVALAQYIFHTTRFQQQRKHMLLNERWLEYLVTPPQRRDLNIERLILNYAHTNLNDELLARNFENISLNKTSEFYKILLDLRHVKLRNSFYEPLIDKQDEYQAIYFVRKFLHFSILLIKQPLYHYFATEDFNLWYKANLHHSTDGFYAAWDCLLQQTELHTHDYPKIYSDLPEQQVQEIYRFHNAFSQCQHDYEFWLQAESFAFAEDFVLEYFKLNAQRIIFYAVAQLYCGRNDHLYRSLINRSFLNMQTFAQAFNCSHENSSMNPIVKCMQK